MVDPQAKGKVRNRLRTTLVEAEVCASRAADTIMAQSGKLAAFVAEKRNGRPKPIQP